METVRFGRTSLGNRTSFELMWNGGKELALTYEYDPENRLAEVNNEGDRTTYEYDPAGRVLKTVNQTTGLTDALTRNDAGLPVSQLITWGPRLLYLFEHDYDLSGDMVKKVGWGYAFRPAPPPFRRRRTTTVRYWSDSAWQPNVRVRFKWRQVSPV